MEIEAPESLLQSSVDVRSARVSVELSDDPQFARRISRLAFTSVIALGVIYFLARFTSNASATTVAALAAGWVLMPAILFMSLRFPLLRYALVIPSTLVAISLIAITALAVHDSIAVLAGWFFIGAGVLLGGVLGVWFWFRWIPVPTSLDDPFSPGRWTLIRLHVFLIVSGCMIVFFSMFIP